MKRQESKTNKTYVFKYYPNDIRRELEARERELKREYENLDRKSRQTKYTYGEYYGYDAYDLGHFKEEERNDLKPYEDRIDEIEKEIEQLKELIKKTKNN